MDFSILGFVLDVQTLGNQEFFPKYSPEIWSRKPLLTPLSPSLYYSKLYSTTKTLLLHSFGGGLRGLGKSASTLTTCYEKCVGIHNVPCKCLEIVQLPKMRFSALIADRALVEEKEQKLANPSCSSSTICSLQASNIPADGGSKLLQVPQVDRAMQTTVAGAVDVTDMQPRAANVEK